VTGYFIPSLLAWNEQDRASAYGAWLSSCQANDGSWDGPNGDGRYVFDTGQVVKGLLALAKATGDDVWRDPIYRACDWMCSTISDSGEPVAADVGKWGDAVPLGVLLYAFQAVRDAGNYLEEPRWSSAVDRAINWLLAQPALTDFTHLSHFHAYILESLCDLGHHDRAREGLEAVARFQRRNGAVPGYPNVRWVCSTGLFQYAIVWYKLGERERGDLAFNYAAKLQNRSGGWYGSYGWFAKYFPKTEISWAVKYFLDALEWRLRVSFEHQSSIFSEKIDLEDGRYRLVRNIINKTGANIILDAGCGKGRYLRNLLAECSGLDLHAVDLSTQVMATLPSSIKKSQGSLLRLPYPDAQFDCVYSVEALEHAVHIDGALRELVRVLKRGGTLIIIDKRIEQLGRLELPDWEQWFGIDDLARRLQALGCEVTIHDNVSYDGRADGLFAAWVAVRRD
jgi:malonyl-CoA O-methyltransferase